LSAPGGVYAFEFARGARTLFVAWSESGKGSFDLPHPAGGQFVTRPSGKRTAISSSDGVLRIRLERSPAIYDVPRVSAPE
jgi:hypothetical protein